MNLADIKHSIDHAWSALEPVKPHLDIAAVGSFALTLLGVLPSIVTGITTFTTLVWSCIRLYETSTVQDFLARRRAARPGGAP